MSLLNQYTVLESLNKGSFGTVYCAYNNVTKTFVALKVEREDLKQSQVYNEARVYQYLKDTPGFAVQHAFLAQQNQRILVLELLGANLLELFKECGHKFSLKTVTMIALQMIDRLETFHSRGFIHRDIKPQNILIGRGDKSKILYLADFGLTSPFLPARRDGILPPLVTAQVTGNQLFSSTGNHMNYQQGPKDDLESLAYMLVYLLTGALPWSNIQTTDPNKRANILTNTKMTSSVTEICKDCPDMFGDFLRTIKSLKSDDTPDYNALKQMFIDFMEENEIQNDLMFDWAPIHKEQKYSLKIRRGPR